MASMTHREYLTRLAWLREYWKEPSRSDYYLMQIAQEVRRVLSKKPNSIKLKDFIINFLSPGEKSQPDVDLETATRWSKMRWGALLSNFKGVRKTPPTRDAGDNSHG